MYEYRIGVKKQSNCLFSNVICRKRHFLLQCKYTFFLCDIGQKHLTDSNYSNGLFHQPVPHGCHRAYRRLDELPCGGLFHGGAGQPQVRMHCAERVRAYPQVHCCQPVPRLHPLRGGGRLQRRKKYRTIGAVRQRRVQPAAGMVETGADKRFHHRQQCERSVRPVVQHQKEKTARGRDETPVGPIANMVSAIGGSAPKNRQSDNPKPISSSPINPKIG